MREKNFWKERVKEGAILNPIDRISEVLFGLIMVLTFTGAISAAKDGEQEIRELLWAALGCNVAWGLVDAIMYWMNLLMERGHDLFMVRKIKESSKEESRKILKDEIRPAVASLMTDNELDTFSDRLKQMPEPSKGILFTARDILAGIEIFLLVFLCTLPVALPFLFMNEVALALRVSNGIALLLLFIGGYTLAGYAGFRRLLTATLYTIIGVILVALTIALGG